MPTKTNINSKTFSQQDVSQWLTDIGLPHYSSLFEFHKLCGVKVLELTNTDLIKIGITKIGDRKRLLRYIEELAHGNYMNSAMKVEQQQKLELTKQQADSLQNTNRKLQQELDFSNSMIKSIQSSIETLLKSFEEKILNREMQGLQQEYVLRDLCERQERERYEMRCLMERKRELAVMGEALGHKLKEMNFQIRALEEALLK